MDVWRKIEYFVCSQVLGDLTVAIRIYYSLCTFALATVTVAVAIVFLSLLLLAALTLACLVRKCSSAFALSDFKELDEKSLAHLSSDRRWDDGFHFRPSLDVAAACFDRVTEERFTVRLASTFSLVKPIAKATDADALVPGGRDSMANGREKVQTKVQTTPVDHCSTTKMDCGGDVEHKAKDCGEDDNAIHQATVSAEPKQKNVHKTVASNDNRKTKASDDIRELNGVDDVDSVYSMEYSQAERIVQQNVSAARTHLSGHYESQYSHSSDMLDHSFFVAQAYVDIVAAIQRHDEIRRQRKNMISKWYHLWDDAILDECDETVHGDGNEDTFRRLRLIQQALQMHPDFDTEFRNFMSLKTARSSEALMASRFFARL